MSAKREVLGIIDPNNAEQVINYFSDQIRNENVEHAIVVERDGKVIHFVGDKDGVRGIDSNLDGAHLLHNHPASNGILSFGEDDFVTIRDNQKAVYHLCNERYDYRLEVVKDMTELTYNEIYWWPGIEKLATGDDYQHLVMEELCERGYVKYERIERR